MHRGDSTDERWWCIVVTAALTLGLTAVVLAAVAAVGVWYSRGQVDTVESFLLARGSAGEWQTTATLVASVMGVWILLAPAEAGAAFGGLAAVLGYGVGEALPMLAYARLGPRIREVIPEGHSLTEYALARYGPATYAFVLLVSVFYMFVFLAAELTGITSAFQFVAGVPRWQTALLVGGFVLAYTVYGGLRASLVTDAVQTAVLLPLLGLTAVGALVALGGPAAVHGQVIAADPQLLDPTFVTGLRFGFWVALAILGAELVNQSWWQRIYAAEDAATLRRGFHRAAALNFLIVTLAGLFGVAARGAVELVVDPTAAGYDASVAFFVLLQEAFPEPLVVVVALLALVLVSSSADTLFNALASLVTADLPRLLSEPDDRTLRVAARLLTVVVAAAAVYVSLRARSVLQLFLLADLFGAATMVPLLSGLYVDRVNGEGALAGGLLGLGVGVVYFPNALVRETLTAVPGLGGLLPPPDFLIAFVGAVAVSTAVTAVSLPFGTPFDIDRLGTDVRRLGATVEADEAAETRADGGFEDAETHADGGSEK